MGRGGRQSIPRTQNTPVTSPSRATPELGQGISRICGCFGGSYRQRPHAALQTQLVQTGVLRRRDANGAWCETKVTHPLKPY